MTASFATISTTRDFDRPVETVFAHWISPEARLRFEAPPESGMRYDGFDTRAGGVEIVRVTHEGAEIGHMVQRILHLDPNASMAVMVEGRFGGQVTMMMSLVIAFEAAETGTRVTATSQVTDLTGRDVEAEHTQGWTMLLDAFAADLAEHT